MYSMPLVFHAFYIYFSYLNTQLPVYIRVSVSTAIVEGIALALEEKKNPFWKDSKIF